MAAPMTLRDSIADALLVILKHYPNDDTWSQWAKRYSAGSDQSITGAWLAAHALPAMHNLEDIKAVPEDKRKELFAKDAACRAVWYLDRMEDPADMDGVAFNEMWVKEKVRAIHAYLGE